ncbi:MAG: COR domain-containing protein [Acidobacteriota bacterium]
MAALSDRRFSRERKQEAEKRIQTALSTKQKQIDLGQLGLRTVPRRLLECTHIEDLDLSKNQLKTLPNWISAFTRLRRLQLAHNRLSTAPRGIKPLTNLTQFSLAGNPIRKLPDWIGNLSLKELFIPATGLAQVPSFIRKLKGLTTLSLGENRITAVPEWIAELTELSRLGLSDNGLTLLPGSMNAMRSLQELFLQGNPELGIPAEILGPRWGEQTEQRKPSRPAAILDYYFRTHLGNSRPLNEAKLILLGRGEVGKTSLVDRLVHDRFVPKGKTEGIQITEYDIPDADKTKIQVHVWDFGGQEIMHATHQFFLTERSLYLVVVNGREGGEDADVDYWLKLIETFGGDSPVIVVLNKIRSHPFDLNRQGLREKYSGRIRAFVKTDCEHRTGIDELREAVTREISALEHLRDRFPEEWFAVKAYLSNMKENYLSFQKYRELCARLGETQTYAQDTLAVALHCLGIALNYRDDPRLRDTHILNPHWVTAGIYKILNSALLERTRGELHVDDLSLILDEQSYPHPLHEFLLNLMRKFDLCFRFPEPKDDTFLIPELLGKEKPDLGEQFDPGYCLNFEYKYSVWPEGLLPRFIVRTHALSSNQHRWRTGVVLEFEGNRSLVNADPQEKNVRISVNGPVPGRRRLLAIIRSDFERIHADLPKLNPSASVPLLNNPAVTVPYEELRAFEVAGIKLVPRVVGGQVIQVDVAKLLTSVEIPTSLQNLAAQIFISYSHKDDELRSELDAHLKLFQRSGLVSAWHDRRITPGDEWKGEIDRKLESANLVLLLISADFLASDYCYDIEMKRALERQEARNCKVLPVIVRDCHWQIAPFAKLQALPKDGRAVRLWTDRDSAWRNVAEGIEKTLSKLSL